MVKLLHYWLSRLTLFCLLAFAAGGAYAQMTIDVKVEGNGSATLSYMDMSVGTDLIPLALETKTYEFGAMVYDGFMLSVQEGTLLSVEVNGELKEGYLPGLNAGQTQLISFGKTDASLKLVFSDDGGVEPVEKTNMTINLSVEGGEADVTYRAMLANGTTVNEAFELGENKLNLFKNAGSGYVVNIYVEAKDGYAVKEVYLNEQLQGNPSAFYISTQEDNQVYDIRVVCEESEPEPVYTQTYNVTINGEGAATYSYQDAATGQRTEYAPLASGTYNWNVLANSITGKYYVSIKTTPADGYVLSSITANGENVDISAAAYGQAVSVGSTEPVVDLVITFAPVVTAEDFTFNFEVEGEGSMQFGPFMGTGFKYEDKAIANGDTYTYSTSDLTDNNGWYVSLRGIDGQATPNLAGVYINGVLNESVTDILQEQNDTYFSVPKDVNPATIKLVFEEASAQVNGVIHCEVTGDVEASATLTWVSKKDYSVNIKKDFVNGQDAVFENLDLDGETEGMYVQITGITPGEELTDILVNGVRDEEAWESFEFYRKYGQYNTGVTISPSNGGYDATVTLVFGESEPEPEYDFLINLTVEGGEAAVKAQYTDANAGRQTIDLVEGENYISNVAPGLIGNKRSVTIMTYEVDGYTIKEVYLNEESQQVGRAMTISSSEVPATYDLRVVCESEEPVVPEVYNQTYEVEIEGSGTVGYEYTDADGALQSGDFANGNNYFNVQHGESGYYVKVSPEAGEGYALSEIWIDGAEADWAVADVNDHGYFENTTETDVTKVKVVFAPAIVTQTFHVTINGEGCGATYKYTDATTQEIVTGRLENGGTYGMNPSVLPSGKFTVTINPEAAAGYEIASATANGEELDVTYWMIQGIKVNTADTEVNLVLNFEPIVVEDFVVNFEVDGTSNMLFTADFDVDAGFIYGEDVVVDGDSFTYKTDKLFEGDGGWYVSMMTNDDKKASTLDSVYINGTFDETLTTNLQMSGSANFGLPKDVNPATIKLVFENAGEPEPDMIVNLTVENYEGVEGGSATVSYAGGTLNVGENKLYDILSGGSYEVALSVIPTEGYAIRDVYIDDVKTYNTPEAVYITRAEKGSVVNVRVVCDEAYTITMKPTGIEGVSYSVRLALLDLKENRNYMSAVDEDVIVAVPKSVSNPYFTWNRDVGSYYTFRDFLVNGKSIYDVSADGGGQQYNITSDVELELVVVETEYYELTTVACEGGKYYIEYEEFDMQSGNYIWLPYEEGIDALMTGTAYRVTFEAAEGYVLLGAYVNDEQVFSATVADEEYEYTYEGVVWSPIEFKMVTKPLSVDGVYAEPVQMYVYSVDGMLIRSCMAKSVDEAVEGLAQGLYIVNGRKVVVEK